MAGLGKASARSSAAQVTTKEDLTCSLCLDRLKDPRLLPCLHSFCKHCLVGLVRRARGDGRVVCPKCRCTHDTPKSGVEGFPSDLVAANALAFYRDLQKPKAESPSPISCNMCAEGDPATSHCPACNRFLCDFCSKAHKRQVDFRAHKLVPLDKADADALKAFERPRYCSQHQGEVLKLYCKMCQQLICRDCTIVEHRDHSFGFTSTLRPQVEQEVKEMAKTMVAKQTEFQAHLEFLKTAERCREEHSTDLQKAINASFDSLVRRVEQERQKLLNQEEGAKTGDLKRMWGQKEFIEVTLANIASGIRYVDRLCSCANDQDMLAMSHEVKRQLSAVRTKTWSPDTSFRSSNLFTFSDAVNRQQLAENVGILRSVQSSDFTVSVRPVGFEVPNAGLHPCDVDTELRNVLRFAVEVRCNPQSRLNHTVTPSVEVEEPTKRICLDYAHLLVYEEKSGSWLLTFVPTYPSFFHISVWVSTTEDQSCGRPLRQGINQTGHFSASAQAKSRSRYVKGRADQHRAEFSVRVRGTLKVGDRVRRGPGWGSGDEDGGVGSEGVVVKVEPFSDSAKVYSDFAEVYYGRGRKGGRHLHSEVPSGKTTVNVLWDNGTSAEYAWSMQNSFFPIELVPYYLLVEK